MAAAKKLLIDELLADFPWHSDADKANCLAMLLTSFLEPYAEFLSPLFVLDALKSGSGKTFLARLLLETAGAHFRTWVNDEAEIRKGLTACLMESDRAIIFDDVGREDTVSSATLSSALTKRRWDDRVLGVSKNFRGTNNRTWVLTGNNVKFGGDIPSRSVLIHLNPGATDPKQREVSKFALGDLDVWLGRDENKVRVIRALLTLIMAWVDHGAAGAMSITVSPSGRPSSAGSWSTRASRASWTTRRRSRSMCTTTSPGRLLQALVRAVRRQSAAGD